MPQSQKVFDRKMNKKYLDSETRTLFENQLNCCKVRNVHDDDDDDDNNNNNKCNLLACGKQTGLMLSLKVIGLVSLRSAMSWLPVRAS